MRCHAFQALFRAKNNALLIQVTLFSPHEAEGTLFVRALTPLGAVLTGGSVLVVDDATPESMPYVACWPRGCVAEMPLTPDFEAALRAGQILALLVKNADTGQIVRFDLALGGLGAALDKFREK